MKFSKQMNLSFLWQAIFCIRKFTSQLSYMIAKSQHYRTLLQTFCMKKPSLKFPILFLNINWRFLILDVQKLERMFKPNTSVKLILVLLTFILVAQGQLIKRDDVRIEDKNSKLVTVTSGEPVLRTQTIQTKQTIVRGNGNHHDHSNIVFDGPEEEIVMRITLQFDKELKHFRIQRLNYENEDLEDEVVIQDVTQTKRISQNVTTTIDAIATDEDPNNKWMRLFKVDHDKVEKEFSEQKSSSDQDHQVSVELPVVAKAKELLVKKNGLSREDEESIQEKESENEAESASTSTQGSTPNSGSGLTSAEQTFPASSEGSTTPVEQTPPTSPEGSAPVDQTSSASTESSLQGEQTPITNNSEASPALVEQYTPAISRNESGSVSPTQISQAHALAQDSDFLSLFD